MSDRMPTFKPNDRVRIMATCQMERDGLANRTGLVITTRRTAGGHQLCEILLDDRSETAFVMNDSLMRAN